jgi:hypothetical protein
MTVLTDDISQRVLFADGEALDTGDLNDAQLLIQAKIQSLLVWSVADAIDDPTSLLVNRDLESGQDVNAGGLALDDVVFSPFTSAGFVYPSGTARKLVWVGGTIVQVIGDPTDADGESIAVFRLVSDGVTGLTTAIGDATNPRIDLVEIKLEYVGSDSQSRNFEDAVSRAKSSSAANRKKSVQCTIQIKQGTPATPPTYPAPSAGFVPLAAIRVPATHNAVHDPLNLRDMRVPLGHVTCYDVPASEFWYPGANPWVRADGNPAPALYADGPAASTGELFAMCPVGNKNARIVGIGLHQRGANSARLVAVDHVGPTAPTITLLADLSGGSIVLTGTPGFRNCSMVQLAVELGAAGAPVNNLGARVANTRIGTPLWCSGFPAGVGYPAPAAPQNPFRQVAVGVTGGSTDQVQLVRFYVAHGL